MNKQKQIYLDLDGVVVNWTKAAMGLCGINADEPAVVNTLTREYDAIDKLVGWALLAKHINSAGTDYWVDLEFLPWGRQLVEYAINRVGSDNVAFVTSPGRFPHAPTGKFLWREKYYPGLNLVITKAKHLLAKENAILIDDDSRQIDAFKAAGGATFLWPNQYILHKDGNETTWMNLARAINATAGTLPGQ